MSASYYDVVVLGSDIAPLCAGALLAKRGFRVLLLGQNEPEPTYDVGSFTLPRRPFHFVIGQSPLRTRIFPELGLGQSVRRMSRAIEPAFQVAMPGHRFDVASDDTSLGREMEREFPELRRPIEDFHKHVARAGRGLDALLERDLVLPPETFLERQRFARIRQAQDLPRGDHPGELLAEFPDAHPFRVVAQLPAHFECAVDPEQTTALMLSRLYGNCQRGALGFQGGLPALRELLIQKIQAHSGQVRLTDRASDIAVSRGQVTGVQLAGSGEDIACSFVVVGTDVSAMLRLLPDRAVFERLFERVGEPLLRQYRYTLNFVLRSEGLPRGLGEHLYLVRSGEHAAKGHGDRIRVHTTSLGSGHVLLCTETLLPSRKVEDEDGFLSAVRENVLEAIRELVPFLDQHLVVVDSPHDGRPPQGDDVALDMTTSARRGPSTMPAIYSYPVLSTLGLCALPVRTPIKRLLLCNGQVIPGLGSEGQWLAACVTARVVSLGDRSKAWMRRRLWSKVEM